MDHIESELMWDEVNKTKVPRRLDRLIPISEVDANPAKFFKEN